jgi:glycosyltransferase involved in cell wall biosynthesis
MRPARDIGRQRWQADMPLRIGFLVSHPIQYYGPIFRALAARCDLTVFYAHRQTAEQQARAGFGVAFDWDIDLLSGYESRFLRNVARSPSTDSFLGCNTPDIAAEIDRGSFDAFVVPGWALRSYWQAVSACRRAGVPVFVRGDSQLGGQRTVAVRLAKALVFRRLLRQFDGYFYVGQRNRDYLLHHGAPADRLFFSPHCVDNEAFGIASDAARRQLAGATRDPARPRRVLFSGKLIARKRPFDLVRAAAQLRGNGTPVELVFVGAGELEADLKQAAQAAGVAADFHGFVNQSKLPAIYASADVIALPSDGRETWGLVINEAMACGTPAVVSDAVGCGPDLIEAGVTGAVFPLGDVGALAMAIDSVLTFDPEATRRRLRERLEIYSPARAADGVIAAATTLAARTLLN